MLSRTPIDHASLVACNDVSVDHFIIDFPDTPTPPIECPQAQSGDPHCGEEEDAHLDPEGSNACSTESTSEEHCLAAVQGLLPEGQAQGRLHLVAGSWAHVPVGCSAQSGGDWAAHFNRRASGNNDGGYSPVCTGPEAVSSPTFVGCFVDDGSRDLQAGPRRYGFTIASCANECGSYSYFALQANGWCVCGNEYSTEVRYSQRPDGECGNACAGESSGRCGGGWRNAVYSVNARPEPDYVGCFVDDGARDLHEGPRAYGYTSTTCAEACDSYSFFALQHNGWCVCGNAHSTDSQYSQVADNECGNPCAGESNG